MDAMTNARTHIQINKFAGYFLSLHGFLTFFFTFRPSLLTSASFCTLCRVRVYISVFSVVLKRGRRETTTEKGGGGAYFVLSM